MLDNNNHYGYLIKFDDGFCLQVDLLHQNLFKVTTTKKDEPRTLSVRTTKMKLLCYLLEKANNIIVSREELLSNVWEASSLSSSYPRLLQVVKKLEEDLQYLGVPDDFINYSRGEGYSITCKYILKLYFKTESDCSVVS